MKLYNSLTRQVESFESLGNVVTIYVCGVTPYDTTHLGHAFTYVLFDALIRYLESRGYTVRYVQNVTDIDDDILRQAEKEGIDWKELGDRETQRFLQDMAALNVRPPDVFPRATQETEMMIRIAQDLLAKGFAYERNGSVYYRVHADPEFGKLSGYDYDTMLATANERGNYPDDPNKEDPLDFVLWQAAKPGEPTWDSPWGPGRPGWHIECSAMSMRYLGPTIDIHGGGEDLLFPHHEAEIAQSEKYTAQHPFVRFWMHIAMVRMDGEKMSKSLGNMVFVRDLLKEYAPDDIRAYLLSHHYRRAFEWDPAEMVRAAERAAHWRRVLGEQSNQDSERGVDPAPFAQAFHEVIQEDFDTPAALHVLDKLAEEILSAAEAVRDVTEAQRVLRSLGSTIGFTFEEGKRRNSAD
ncbi:MAG: cysteine--tRNA ligase [Chloroflexota bacterium]|nr:cysteine--tRNA ligase [Chloroflexota bacterium]